MACDWDLDVRISIQLLFLLNLTLFLVVTSRGYFNTTSVLIKLNYVDLYVTCDSNFNTTSVLIKPELDMPSFFIKAISIQLLFLLNALQFFDADGNPLFQYNFCSY